MPARVSSEVGVRRQAEIEFPLPRSWARSVGCVQFVARRGSRFLRCYVTRQALVDCFGAAAPADDGGQGECLRTFDRYRGTIEQVAQGRLEAAPPHTRVLVLAVDDFRPLCGRQPQREVDIVV